MRRHGSGVTGLGEPDKHPCPIFAGEVVQQVETSSPGHASENTGDDDEVLEVFDSEGQVVTRIDLAAETVSQVAAQAIASARKPSSQPAAPGFGMTAADFAEEEAPAAKKPSASEDFGVAYAREALPGENQGASNALPGALASETDAFDEEEVSSTFVTASLAAQSSRRKPDAAVVGSMAGPSDSDSDSDDFAFDAPATAPSSTPAPSAAPAPASSEVDSFMQRLAAAKQADKADSAAEAEAAEARRKLAAESAAAAAAAALSSAATAEKASRSRPIPGSSTSAAADFTVQHSSVRTATGSAPVFASSDTSSVDEGTAMVSSAGTAMGAVQHKLQQAAAAKEKQEQVEREERVLAKGAQLKELGGGADTIIEEDEEEEEEEEVRSEGASAAAQSVVVSPEAVDSRAGCSTWPAVAQKQTAEPAKCDTHLHTAVTANEQASDHIPRDTTAGPGPMPVLTQEQELAAAAAQFDAGTAAVSSRSAATSVGDSSAYTAIKHTDAASYLMGDAQAGRFKATVVVKQASSGGLWNALTRTSLSAGLKPERTAVFGMAKVQYDESDEVHQRLMRSMYRALSGSDLVGLTWTAVGFQNDNFVTDLRGVGMLGSLQLLMFAQEHHDFVVSRLMKAEGSPQWYPFAVQSLNMTLYALQALRAEKLNTLANKKDSVLQALHEFYCALFVEFGELFAASGAEGAYAGMLGQKAADACSKDPAAAIAKYKKLVAGGGASSSSVGRGSMPASAVAAAASGGKGVEGGTHEGEVQFSSF